MKQPSKITISLLNCKCKCINKVTKVSVLCPRKSHHWNHAEAYGSLPQYTFTYLFF